MMDKKIVSKKLNEFFGEENIKIITPKKFLSFVEDVLIEQYEQLAKEIVERGRINIDPLIIQLEKNNVLLKELSSKEIKIPEYKEIRIPDYPKEIDIKKPEWYREIPIDVILKELEKHFKLLEFNEPLLSAPFYTNTDKKIVEGMVGKTIYAYAVKLNAIDDIFTYWQSGISDLEGEQSYIRKGGYTESVAPPAFLFKTAIGESLNLAVRSDKNGIAAGRVNYWVK